MNDTSGAHHTRLPRGVAEPGHLNLLVDDAHRRISLSGEFDMAGVQTFIGATARFAGRSTGAITLNLRQLQFIDAAGLGEIVALRNTLAVTDRHLLVTEPTPRIRRTFGVAALSELLCPRPGSESATVTMV